MVLYCLPNAKTIINQKSQNRTRFKKWARCLLPNRNPFFYLEFKLHRRDSIYWIECGEHVQVAVKITGRKFSVAAVNRFHYCVVYENILIFGLDLSIMEILNSRSELWHHKLFNRAQTGHVSNSPCNFAQLSCTWPDRRCRSYLRVSFSRASNRCRWSSQLCRRRRCK